MAKTTAARKKLDLTGAQPAKPATGAASGEAASTSEAAASTAAKAKEELQPYSTAQVRGKRVRGRTPPADKPDRQRSAAQPANAQSALISLLTKAKDAGDTMDDPNYLKEQISKYQVQYPDLGPDEFLAALTKVDPTGVNQGAYNYLQTEAEAVGGAGGNPPPPPASAVADAGTQTNLQEGVVTSSDDSLDPVTDEQGELTPEEITARLQGMVGEATTNSPVAVTSTRFPAYGGDPTMIPRRPTPEQAAANVAGEAAAADADAAAADELTEDDLQQIIGPAGPLELDESVVEPPRPFQPAPEPTPPEAQLGDRREPAVPYTMLPLDVSGGDPLLRQPLDLSGLTNPASVETNLRGMPEGSEPVDIQAYLQALLLDKNLKADPVGTSRMFEGVTPNRENLTRSTPLETFAVGAFQSPSAQFKPMSSSTSISFDPRAERAPFTPIPEAQTNPPQVPVSSIRKLIDAANKNRVLTGGIGAMGLLGGVQAYNIANQKPQEEAPPVVNIDQGFEGLDPEEFLREKQRRNRERQAGAGGLMTNVTEDRP